MGLEPALAGLKEAIADLDSDLTWLSTPERQKMGDEKETARRIYDKMMLKTRLAKIVADVEADAHRT